MVGQVARTPWNREHAIRYIRANHTWGHRAKVYDEILRPLQ
jgi:hypothetical protein